MIVNQPRNIFISTNSSLFNVIIIILFCLQNSLYSDLLLNTFIFNDEININTYPIRLLSLIFSFISAFISWIVPIIIFHISALIFSDNEIKLSTFIKFSTKYLIFPILIEFGINTILFIQSPTVTNTQDLKLLFTTPPYCYFKIFTIISYILSLLGIIHTIKKIYNIGLIPSTLSVISPIALIVIVYFIFILL